MCLTKAALFVQFVTLGLTTLTTAMFQTTKKFYCILHYQDIENACRFGLGEDIWHAMGIGPGVQQQFEFTPGVLSKYFLFNLLIIFWDRNSL